MKSFKKSVFLIILLITSVAFTGCGGGFTDAIQPKNGQTVFTTNKEIAEFVSKKWTTKLCDGYYEKGLEHYAPEYAEFVFDDVADEFFISENADMSGAKVYECSNNEFAVRGLKTGTTYYWQYTSDGNKSAVRSIKTANGVRTLYIGGVTNTRDMGAWTVYDDDNQPKGVIRQGLLFRSATLDNISEAGKDYIVNDLGIKTELDLRAVSETERRPMINGVKYINISCPQYAYNGLGIFEFDGGENANSYAIKNIISVFADVSNYPIDFHCAIGRDRTGTVAFLLGALCGMSEEDLCREYDLSFFAGLDENTPSRMHQTSFLPLLDKMKSYSDSEKSLAYNTRMYLLDTGVTEEDLDNICDILIE